MTYKLNFQLDGEILLVHAAGDRDADNPRLAAKEAWTQVARECREEELSLILIISCVAGHYSTQDAYEIMSTLDQYGVAKTWKIAYVNDDPFCHDDLMFMMTAAELAGFRVKVFATEDEAKKWLGEGQRLIPSECSDCSESH